MREQRHEKKFNIGDRVCLRRDFYKQEEFKRCGRKDRKRISKYQGIVFVVQCIIDDGYDDLMPDDVPSYLCTSDKLADAIAFPETMLVHTGGCDYMFELYEQHKFDKRQYEAFLDRMSKKKPKAKHVYSFAEIREAQRIIGEIVAEADTIYFYDNLLNFAETRVNYNGTFYTAVCSPNDHYNKTIGRMVALCRAAGRKLPNFVR